MLPPIVYDWLYRSEAARLLWDRDTPDEAILRWVERVPDGSELRALDLGCGSGTHAVHLAGLGYRVDGVDLAPTALARADARALGAGVEIATHHVDVLAYESPEPYDLVIDYGCLHNLARRDRPRYAARIAALCHPGAQYVLMALAPRWGLVDWRVLGPHHLSGKTLAALLGPTFETLSTLEIPYYWEHTPAIFRSLSGPYRAMAYHLRRR